MTETRRKRRGHSRFIVFFILLLAGLLCLSWIGYRTLCQADWLNVKTIRVAGNSYVSAQNIRALLQDYTGSNLVAISSSDIKDELYKIKRIKKAEIVRLYPSTLKIKVTERKGFVYLKSTDGDLFPIDENGLILEYAAFPSGEDIPVVNTTIPSRRFLVGKIVQYPFLTRVLALQDQIMQEQPDFLKSVSEYYEDKGLIVIVDAKYGTRIIAGDENLKDQLRRYQFVQENGTIDKDKIFDLRFQNQVVVRQEIQ